MRPEQTVERVRKVVLKVFKKRMRSSEQHRISASSDMVEVWRSIDGYDGIELALGLEDEFAPESIEAGESWNYYPCRKPLFRSWQSDFSTVDEYCHYLASRIDLQMANMTNGQGR